MNNSEVKKLIIRDLFNNMMNEMLEKVDRMPEEWTGIELRWMLSDLAERYQFSTYDKKSKRYKDYKNVCLVKNI